MSAFNRKIFFLPCKVVFLPLIEADAMRKRESDQRVGCEKKELEEFDLDVQMWPSGKNRSLSETYGQIFSKTAKRMS